MDVVWETNQIKAKWLFALQRSELLTILKQIQNKELYKACHGPSTDNRGIYRPAIHPLPFQG